MTSHLNLDPDGNGLAYENGFRDGLKDARADLQLEVESLKSELAASHRAREEDRLEALHTYDTLCSQLAEQAQKLDTATKERLGAVLDLDQERKRVDALTRMLGTERDAGTLRTRLRNAEDSTAERIAAWLEVDLSDDCSEAIAGVRAGAWRLP